MTIPTGFSQVNMLLGGTALPNKAQVTFGVRNVNLATPTTIGTLAITRWNANIQPLLASTITLEGAYVKNGPDANGPFAQVAASQAGGVAAAASLPNLSVLVTKATDLGGRQGRGRMYVPGVTESQTSDSGVFAAGNQATWQSAFTAFLNALNTDNIPMYLLHKDAALPTPVIALNVQSRMATQRKRLRR